LPDLRRLIETFRAGDSDSALAAFPKRDALFALELIKAGLAASDRGTRDAALDLVGEYVNLVRSPLPGDIFECGWYGAVVAALEGALQGSVANDLLPRLLARCPADGRLRLARAFVSDQLAQMRATAVGTSRADPTPAIADGILSRYDEAAKLPDVAREANVRAAWLAHRAGMVDRAMTYLGHIRPPGNDRALDYFGELVRGQVLRARGRPDEAIAAFRSALAAWPGAQSARVGLMLLLVRHGERREAEAQAEAVQADPGTQIDPWWMYWQGDYRLLQVLEANLRELAR
jgi:tetratricopeptide (TPR) repeat protein